MEPAAAALPSSCCRSRSCSTSLDSILCRRGTAASARPCRRACGCSLASGICAADSLHRDALSSSHARAAAAAAQAAGHKLLAARRQRQPVRHRSGGQAVAAVTAQTGIWLRCRADVPKAWPLLAEDCTCMQGTETVCVLSWRRCSRCLQAVSAGAVGIGGSSGAGSQQSRPLRAALRFDTPGQAISMQQSAPQNSQAPAAAAGHAGIAGPQPAAAAAHAQVMLNVAEGCTPESSTYVQPS